jgi:phospholipase C
MLSLHLRGSKRTLATAGIAACVITLTSSGIPTLVHAGETASPIEHVIIIVGENHTFDNVFGTYLPKAGQTIDNLRSKGIVNADGTPGRHFGKAEQRIGSDTDTYKAETISTGSYKTLPQPYTTYAFDVPQGVPDTRFPTNLPNGPFQISKYVPYTAYTGDPVHRFFQMWQDYNGGKLDKFVWVEETIGTGSNGNPPPPPPAVFNPKEGAISMGFYNMNSGDAPIFKSLADTYAISDNYHQAVMGGTGANFQAIISGDATFFTDPINLDGSPAVPFSNQIENPDPVPGTNNYYTQDGYSGGSYVNCADPTMPGVASVNHQLGGTRNNCAPGHYYLVNNYSLFWNQTSSNPRTLGPTSFTLPPQGIPTIANVMTKKNVSWKYYSADRGDDATAYATAVNGVPLRFHSYCASAIPSRAISAL